MPGKTLWLGVHFQIQKDWHIYWNGRNDSGFPVETEITAPPGYTVGGLKWPAPKRHVAEGEILDHIYEGSVTLIFPVEVPAEAKGTADFAAKLSWLVCNESCVAEDAEVRVSVPVGQPGVPAEANAQAKRPFAEARARWPKPIGTAARVEWNGSTATVQVAGAASLTFYPLGDCSEIDGLIRSGTAKGDQLKLQVATTRGVVPELHGVLEVTRTGTGPAASTPVTEWFEIQTKPISAGAGAPAPKS
ncbi:MAG: protein-disulfide reductase DsbD N-terminal domain-containing protein [Phycisphaerales bacterium]|nr:protein-disulfide reductase DsbD N-terminal domain-containing protein [Phycisphaerales bacterium]